MPRYTGEVQDIETYDGPGTPVILLRVAVYGDLPESTRGVHDRTRNAILRAAWRVAVANGVSALDWTDIHYNVGVNNGQYYHTVLFEPNIAGITD